MGALKVVSFLKRRPDLDLPAFSEYWRSVHKAHAMKLVEAGFIRGYIQNHPLGTGLDGLATIADGSPELWIDSADCLQRLVQSREYLEGAGPDEANFSAPPVIACVAEERVLRDGEAPAGAIKLMLAVRRHPQLEMAEFRERWLAGESALLPQRCLRLTRHAALDDDAPIHGTEFSWWPDLETLRQAWQGRDPAAAEMLVARHSLAGLLALEEVVVAPPAQHCEPTSLLPEPVQTES
ncbi:EthD domain protein [compost metagenome]